MTTTNLQALEVRKEVTNALISLDCAATMFSEQVKETKTIALFVKEDDLEFFDKCMEDHAKKLAEVLEDYRKAMKAYRTIRDGEE